jgi:hypothetical protein
MTKINAIRKILEDNGGIATWDIIYRNVEKYYPSVKASDEWQAGIRGVLYREIKNNRNFKKTGLGIFALKEFEEENREKIKADKVRMHSYIEGICIELGNFEKFDTYTANPTAEFKDRILLNNITTLKSIPEFTYSEIINSAKRIDVLWFNKGSYQFPKRTFEVVDSIGTLGEALHRIFQLLEFNVHFHIIGKESDRNKFESKIQKQPYNQYSKRYTYKSYEQIITYYEKRLSVEKMSFFD